MKKKLLSVLLATTMLTSSLPCSVLGETTEEKIEIEETEDFGLYLEDYVSKISSTEKILGSYNDFAKVDLQSGDFSDFGEAYTEDEAIQLSSQATTEITLTIGKAEIIVDGRSKALDVPPVVVDNEVLVPVRAIFEALGASVAWNDTTKTIEATKDDTTVKLTIGNSFITVNGVDHSIPVPAQIIDSRTMVPAKAISEAFGYHVYFNSSTGVMTITDSDIRYNISGRCGENLTWTLDSDGVLAISGEGDMEFDIYSSDYAPWNSYRDKIYEVIIEEGVTNIADNAFYNCKNLKSINIPDSITTIGESAFYICYNMTDITLSENLKTIGDYAFSYCESLTNIDIPDSVTTIGNEAFSYCSSVTDVTIGKGAKNIGVAVFGWCPLLEGISVDENNAYYCDIDGTLFNKNKTLLLQYTVADEQQHYTVPDGVKVISYGAFSTCENLESITFPESLTGIGSYAFVKCSSLKNISIPENVTTIARYAFSNCISLESFNVDKDNTKYCDIDGVLFDKDRNSILQYPAGNPKVSYDIPSGTEIIDEYAFSYCRIQDIMMPDSVIYINSHAFYNAKSIRNITLGKGVTEIGDYAFFLCDNLESVTIKNGIETIGDGVFEYCNKLAAIYYIGTERQWNKITVDYNSNEVLYNVYKMFVLDEEILSFEGAQIRTEGKQGLRFVFKIPTVLARQYEFGSVIMPKKYLGDHSLKIGTVTFVDGKEYAAKQVHATKIFKEEYGYTYFTVCLTNIKKSNYISEYVAVPYVIVKDENGIEYVTYGEETENITVFSVAQEAVWDENCDEDIKEYLNENILSLATKECFFVKGTSKRTLGALTPVSVTDGREFVFGNRFDFLGNIICENETIYMDDLPLEGHDDDYFLSELVLTSYNGHTISAVSLLNKTTVSAANVEIERSSKSSDYYYLDGNTKNEKVMTGFVDFGGTGAYLDIDRIPADSICTNSVRFFELTNNDDGMLMYSTKNISFDGVYGANPLTGAYDTLTYAFIEKFPEIYNEDFYELDVYDVNGDSFADLIFYKDITKDYFFVKGTSKRTLGAITPVSVTNGREFIFGNRFDLYGNLICENETIYMDDIPLKGHDDEYFLSELVLTNVNGKITKAVSLLNKKTVNKNNVKISYSSGEMTGYINFNGIGAYLDADQIPADSICTNSVRFFELTTKEDGMLMYSTKNISFDGMYGANPLTGAYDSLTNAFAEELPILYNKGLYEADVYDINGDGFAELVFVKDLRLLEINKTSGSYSGVIVREDNTDYVNAGNATLEGLKYQSGDVVLAYENSDAEYIKIVEKLYPVIEMAISKTNLSKSKRVTFADGTKLEFFGAENKYLYYKGCKFDDFVCGKKYKVYVKDGVPLFSSLDMTVSFDENADYAIILEDEIKVQVKIVDGKFKEIFFVKAVIDSAVKTVQLADYANLFNKYDENGLVTETLTTATFHKITDKDIAEAAVARELAGKFSTFSKNIEGAYTFTAIVFNEADEVDTAELFADTENKHAVFFETDSVKIKRFAGSIYEVVSGNLTGVSKFIVKDYSKLIIKSYDEDAEEDVYTVYDASNLSKFDGTTFKEVKAVFINNPKSNVENLGILYAEVEDFESAKILDYRIVVEETIIVDKDGKEKNIYTIIDLSGNQTADVEVATEGDRYAVGDIVVLDKTGKIKNAATVGTTYTENVLFAGEFANYDNENSFLTIAEDSNTYVLTYDAKILVYDMDDNSWFTAEDDALTIEEDEIAYDELWDITGLNLYIIAKDDGDNNTIKHIEKMFIIPKFS